MHTLEEKKINRKKKKDSGSLLKFILNELTYPDEHFSLALPSVSSGKKEKNQPFLCCVINFVENEIVLFLRSGFSFWFFFLPSSVVCVDSIMMFSLCARKRIKKQKNTHTHSSCTEKTKKRLKNLLCSVSHFHLDGWLFFVCFSNAWISYFCRFNSTPRLWQRTSHLLMLLQHLSFAVCIESVWERETYTQNARTNAQTMGCDH